MFRLTLLGNVDLTGAERTARDASLRRSKRIALLGYLAAARPRGYHRRDKLAALFWPELSGARARGALRTTLTRLRDEYGAELILARGPDEIAVDPARLACDVAEFDDALTAGRFGEAAGLYTGPLLDGVHVDGAGEELERWIESERARLHAAAVGALVQLSRDADQRGDRRAAIAAAQRAAALSPTDEIVARRLITLFLAASNRGGAMQAYDELARRLRADFEVEPSAETRALLDSMRESSPGAGSRPVGPADSEPAPVPVAAEAPTPAVAPPGTARGWQLAAGALLLVAGALAARLWLAPRAASPPIGPPAATARWTRMTVTTPGVPRPRVHGAVVLDSTDDGLILVGGLTARGEDAAQSPVLDDVWRLAGLDESGAHRWTELHPAPGPAPAPRWNAFAAYDRAADRLLLHGGALGHSSPCANDTWVLDRASGIGGAPRWREVRTTGERPPRHAEAMGVYEPRSRRLVVFGGNDCFNTYMADVWMLTFDDSTLASGRWTAVRPDSSAGAPARRNADAVAYDARARRLWVQGGNLGGANEVAELWRLENADATGGVPAWYPVRCAGDAPALASHVAAYDTTAGALLVFGGIDRDTRARNDVWIARGLSDGGSHCRWEHTGAGEDAPIARYSARAATLPGGRALVVLGGMVESVAFMDIWRLDQPFAAR